MTSPRTPFFWFVNVSEAKRACWSCSNGADDKWSRVSPMKSWTSASLKGVLSLSVYSPGRRRKKKAMMTMSAVAQKDASDAEVDWAKKAMRRMTWMGIGLTRSGAGSEVFHAFNVRWMRKSMLWAEFSRGSLAPTLRNVWATCRT